MSSIDDELCKKKCPSLAPRVLTMMVPLVIMLPFALVYHALDSTCDTAPIASARAPAHKNRFFMSVPFYLNAAMSGGLFWWGI
jgi:hypothetical protein